MSIRFNNSYVRLPERFYTKQLPVAGSDPQLIAVNHELARSLNIDPVWLASEAGVNMVAGNLIPDGAEPIATVYAGHQFGHWNPQLGDGRALLLGEVIDKNGERFDIQLKGSGITPFSRNGDGRAPLGPVLREYIVSEAMTALGIPTTRTLAAVTTGDSVYREAKLAGAVLARVAKSHIRIGTLQYFAAQNDIDGLRHLVDYIIKRHYPEAAIADNPPLDLFEQVMRRQADLIAGWQSVGFIHGVMNTDNMLLSGETIDYGPCAFMDHFDAASCYSSIDRQGRYAYRNQPSIAHWNLACLGQALVAVFDPVEEKAIKMAQTALDQFPGFYRQAYLERLTHKLGLGLPQPDDEQLIRDFFDLLADNRCDFTLAFRRLGELSTDKLPSGDDSVAPWFDFPPAFDDWLMRWQNRCVQETISPEDRYRQMMAVNPVFIARNHQLEVAIQQAYAGDFSMFRRLLDRLSKPFEFNPEDMDLGKPPEPHELVQQTFCGT